MIEMVAEGEIPLTVVDSDIAKLNHTYYDNIDIGIAVSFPQNRHGLCEKTTNGLLRPSTDGQRCPK